MTEAERDRPVALKKAKKKLIQHRHRRISGLQSGKFGD